MKEHDLALEFILQATRKISEFIAGSDLNKFLKDAKTQSAVIMQFIVIGELSKKLPEEIKQEIDLPWKLMAGFRDLAVHQYFALDLNKVWDTAVQNIPVVRKKFEDHIKK